MSYGGAPGSGTAAGRRDAVRLMIGDTDTTNEQLTDTVLDWYLDLADDNLTGAAIRACRDLMAKYAAQVDTTNGALSVGASARFDHYKALLANIEAGAAVYAEPFAGGISISGKRDLETDTDAVQPAISIGMDDYQGAGRTNATYELD